jgi:hypothetical protein
MTGLAAIAHLGDLPSWLTWGQAAWTAGDATPLEAIWFTVACYCWCGCVLGLLGWLIAAEEPGEETLVIVFVGAFVGLMWPIVLGAGMLAAIGYAIVVPPRAALARHRRSVGAARAAADARRDRIAELERDLEIT